MEQDVKEATAQTREMPDEAVRERIIRLGFSGDVVRFDAFVETLREAMPPDVTVVLRGSAVIGCRWSDGQPFDADGPGTSDLDLALVGGGMLKLWRDDAHYIPGLHSAPLDEEHPDVAPTLEPLRRTLCEIAGRPVHLQATTSLVQFVRDVLLDQPYHTLIDAKERAKDGDVGDDARDEADTEVTPPVEETSAQPASGTAGA